MSLACAGYSGFGEFLFISRNPDRNDFHLNKINNASDSAISSLYSQPLSNITGYPNDKNMFFNGLCSFSKFSNSFFLSFDNYNASSETLAGSTTLSNIYQLNCKEGSSGSGNSFYKTPIQLQNTTLFSFVQVADVNKTSSLAFVASPNSGSLNNNQTQFSLNLMSLSNPTSQFTSKAISDNGILAVGGEQSQRVYLLQSSSISEYRLDHMDYTQTGLQTKFDTKGVKAGTSGQVYAVNESDYISVFNAPNSEISIFHHNSSLSHFSPLSFSNGYVSFGSNVNDSPVIGNNKTDGTKIVSITQSSIVPISTVDKKASSTPTKSAAVSTSTNSHVPTTIVIQAHNDVMDKKMKEVNITDLSKRELLQNGDVIHSDDGSFQLQKSSLASGDNHPVSAVALSAASSPQENPPYSIIFLSGDEETGYHSNIMTGSGIPISSNDSEGVSGGAIAGIVIGVIVSLAIVFGLLVYARKRRSRPQIRSYNSMPLSIQPDDFVTPYMKQREVVSADNDSSTSSILQESKCIPEEYHDGSRPDIRPLCYNADKIEYATPSENELTMLEPDVHGPLFLFSGQYISTVDEKVVYINDGYAIRTFSAKDGSKHTVHYFSSANLDSFVKSVYAVTRCKPQKKGNNYIMRSDMAIVLGKPTPHFNYQYIWITSPMIPEQSLRHLLFERKTWSYNIDYRHIDYRIWSIYTILKNVEVIHSHKIAHLAIDLTAFYYDHESKPTDWRLGNFCHARSTAKGNSYSTLPPSNGFTAPEIINQKAGAEVETADVWSAACVIYTIATSGLSIFENDTQVKTLATFKNDLEQHIKIAVRDNIDNATFKTVLEMMLHVDPQERKSIPQVLDFWCSIYNMEG
ncbi:unnamed protein product [Mucor hiemalis]